MPTYEYECLKCGKVFDYFQSMKDDALERCPKEVCEMKPKGRGKVKRLVGAGAGLIFKGSGFYITDYRSESYKAGAKSEASAGKPEKSGDSAKSSKSESSTPSSTPKKSPGKPSSK